MSPLYPLGCSLLTVSGSRYGSCSSQSRLEEPDGRSEEGLPGVIQEQSRSTWHSKPACMLDIA